MKSFKVSFLAHYMKSFNIVSGLYCAKKWAHDPQIVRAKENSHAESRIQASDANPPMTSQFDVCEENISLFFPCLNMLVVLDCIESFLIFAPLLTLHCKK